MKSREAARAYIIGVLDQYASGYTSDPRTFSLSARSYDHTPEGLRQFNLPARQARGTEDPHTAAAWLQHTMFWVRPAKKAAIIYPALLAEAGIPVNRQARLSSRELRERETDEIRQLRESAEKLNPFLRIPSVWRRASRRIDSSPQGQGH